MPCSHHEGGPGPCTYCHPFCDVCHRQFCSGHDRCVICNKTPQRGCPHVYEQRSGQWDGFGG